MSTVIDTPGGIAYYQLCVHVSRLNIEINTGLTSRLSTLKSAQVKYGRFFPGGIGHTRVKVRDNLEILKELVMAGKVRLV